MEANLLYFGSKKDSLIAPGIKHKMNSILRTLRLDESLTFVEKH